jgi:hypothetical protein
MSFSVFSKKWVLGSGFWVLGSGFWVLGSEFEQKVSSRKFLVMLPEERVKEYDENYNCVRQLTITFQV